MAKLRADRKNYKKAFTTHADAMINGILVAHIASDYFYVTVWNVALSV